MKKTINTKVAIVMLCAFAVSYGNADAVDAPTANLTERWTSSDAGWVIKDAVTATTKPVVWTNGSVGVKFVARGINDFPTPELVGVSGTGSASSGRFVGDYNLKGIESVSFDIITVNLLRKPTYYFISGANKWFFTLSDVPETTGSNGVSKTIPFVYSSAWKSSAGSSYATAVNFEADKANVSEIGIGAERYLYPEQSLFVYNMKLIGPWGGPLASNNVPVAWLLENNIQESAVDTDGDGFSNVAEYLAGTNPNDSNSFFSVKIKRNDLGKIVVTWNENKYVWFDLMQTTNLSDPNSFSAVSNATDLPGSGAVREVEVDDSGAGVKFFKIVIKPNPSKK